MKTVTSILICAFCLLIGMQICCDAGWTTHDKCHDGNPSHDDFETCRRDPCRISYDSPRKLKTSLDVARHSAAASDRVEIPAPVSLAADTTPESIFAGSPPRPAGAFPLLV